LAPWLPTCPAPARGFFLPAVIRLKSAIDCSISNVTGLAIIIALSAYLQPVAIVLDLMDPICRPLRLMLWLGILDGCGFGYEWPGN
jgi:hypothetical protein